MQLEKMKFHNSSYVAEIVEWIRCLQGQELADKIENYHENDLADALAFLTPPERLKMYRALGVEKVAEIFAYLEDAGPYFEELEPRKQPRYCIDSVL